MLLHHILKIRFQFIFASFMTQLLQFKESWTKCHLIGRHQHNKSVSTKIAQTLVSRHILNRREQWAVFLKYLMKYSKIITLSNDTGGIWRAFDWLAGWPIGSSAALFILFPLQPVSGLTGAASGTVLCWHWWLRHARPSHSGWKHKLAFSWSWMGDGGDGALPTFDRAPHCLTEHTSSGRKNCEGLTVLLKELEQHFRICVAFKVLSLNFCNENFNCPHLDK